MSDTPPIVAMLRRYGNSLNVLQTDIGADFRHAADTIEALLAALEDVHARGATDGAGGVAIRMSLDRYAQLHTAIAKARGQS
jgi:hypothetical protein